MMIEVDDDLFDQVPEDDGYSGPDCSFPQHIPFSDMDLEPGELALAYLAPFQKGELQLLQGVLARDLEPLCGQPEPNVKAPDILDYLICRGDYPLAALAVTDRNESLPPPATVPGLPYLHITREQLMTEDFQPLSGELTALLRQSAPARWRVRLRPLDQAHLDHYQEAQLLDCGVNGWYPTEYGSTRGLVKHMTPQGTRNTEVLCSRTTRISLDILLKLYADGPTSDEGMDFLDRLDHVRSGTLCSSATSAQLVRDLADIPLKDYFGEKFPEGTDQFAPFFPQGGARFRDAALVIGNMVHSEQPETVGMGIELLLALAHPAACYASARVGLHMMSSHSQKEIYATFPNMEDAMSRDLPVDASLEVRLDRLHGAIPMGEKLNRLPLLAFYQGVSFLTGMEYPLWLGKHLLNFFQVPPDFPYSFMVNEGVKWNDSDFSLPPSTPKDTRLTGLYVLYLTMVEPFRLLRQAEAKNMKGAD